MDRQTEQTARTAAKRSHRSPYQQYDTSMNITRAWIFLTVWVDSVVAWNLAAGRTTSQWMVWTFVVVTVLTIISYVFAPIARRKLKRKNALAREQVFQVRKLLGAQDGSSIDLVSMGIGNLLDADPALDRRTAGATAVFIAASVQQLLTDVEAQTADKPAPRR